MLKTILKLKRSLSPVTLSPMGWREIGKRQGVSAVTAQNRAVKELPDIAHRCPTCLQKLEVMK